MPCSLMGADALWESSRGGRLLYGALHKSQKLLKEKLSRASLQR